MHELLSFLVAKPDVTNAIAAIASAVVAFLALAVSAIALYVAHATLKHQRQHNRLSLKPIPFVSLGDYENRLVVYLKNHGSGPLVVKNLSAQCKERVESALLTWMPELPDGVLWTTFVVSVRERAVLPGDSITLLELSGDDDDPTFAKARDDVRLALAPLSVTVDYTDVYETTFEPYSRPLDWFGRHFSMGGDEDAQPCGAGDLAHKAAPGP